MYLDSLGQQIESRLKSGTIGKAVFVRAHLQLTADHGLLLPLAAEGLELAQRWIATPVHAVYPLGGVPQGFINLMVDFSGGEAALITAELTLGGEAVTQLLITGQHGSLRLDEYPEPSQLTDLTGNGQRWLRGITTALATGRQMITVRE